jgi:hypothetical protein
MWPWSQRDRIVRANRVRDFVPQQIPFLEDVAASRDEAAFVALDMRDRAEAVPFRLEDPIGMSKDSEIRTRGIGRTTRCTRRADCTVT